MQKIKLFFQILLSTALVFSAVAQAQVTVNQQDPQALVNDVYKNIVAEVSKNKDRLATDKQYLRQVLDNALLPYLDKVAMGKSMLGTNIWKSASKEQRQQFIDKFFQFLLDKYASSIALYNGQQLEFKPVQQGSNKRLAEVAATIKQANNQSLDSNIVFSLLQDKSLNWKIYNFSVGTTSMVKNFGYTYQSEVAKFGFEHMLKKLDADIAEARTGK